MILPHYSMYKVPPNNSTLGIAVQQPGNCLNGLLVAQYEKQLREEKFWLDQNSTLKLLLPAIGLIHFLILLPWGSRECNMLVSSAAA